MKRFNNSYRQSNNNKIKERVRAFDGDYKIREAVTSPGQLRVPGFFDWDTFQPNTHSASNGPENA